MRREAARRKPGRFYWYRQVGLSALLDSASVGSRGLEIEAVPAVLVANLFIYVSIVSPGRRTPFVLGACSLCSAMRGPPFARPCFTCYALTGSVWIWGMSKRDIHTEPWY